MERRAIIGVVLGAVALFGGFVYLDWWRETKGPGRAEHAHFTNDSSRVVIVDRASAFNRRRQVPRVRVLDARTGAELARERLWSTWRARDTAWTRDVCFDCIPAAGGRMWCCDMTGDDGLSLRSLDTLAVLADEKRLYGLAPGLVQGLSKERRGPDLKPMVDLDDGALLARGKDERLYRIGADLSARVEPPRTFDKSDQKAFAKWATDTMHMGNLSLPAHAVTFARHGGLITRAKLAGRTFTLEKASGASQRRVIITFTDPMAADRDPYGPPPRQTPRPDESYLDAGFLADPDWGEFKPVVIADPETLVLAHVELASAGKQLVLSSVNRDGQLGWSRALGLDDVRGARLIGDLLVVVLGDSLIGLDPASGAVRFQRPL